MIIFSDSPLAKFLIYFQLFRSSLLIRGNYRYRDTKTRQKRQAKRLLLCASDIKVASNATLILEMCHMLFIRFIFVRRGSRPSFPSFSSSLFLSFSRVTSVSLATFVLSLARRLSFFILTSSPLAPSRSPARLVRGAPPFSLLFLSLTPNRAPRLSFTRYLVDSPLGFARVTLISLPSVSPSRLHSRDAFSAFLPLSRCRPVLSRLPRARARLLSFSTCSPLRRDSSVYCVRVSFSFSLSFPTRSSCAPFDPRRAVFLPFFLVRSTVSLSLSRKPKVYSLGAGPVKNLADPKRF